MTELSELPYYAVIFTSKRKLDDKGYGEMSARMNELSAKQKGFLGIDSARSKDGVGITVSYWQTLEDIKNWKKQSEHLDAQSKGRSIWYESYQVRICKVERQYESV